jgi:sugar lactone lactonase YvrE
VPPTEFPGAAIPLIGSVAVDQGSGDVYVVQPEGQLAQGAIPSLILRFDSEGNEAAFTASASYISGNEITGTPVGELHINGGQVAVAPPGAAGGTAGDIYVATNVSFGQPGSILIFAPTGRFLGRITEANGEPFTFAGSGGAASVGVDATGDVYVGETSGGKIDKYVPRSNPVANGDYDSRISTGIQVSQLAASNSALYVAQVGNGETLTEYPLSSFPGGGGEFNGSGSGTTIEAEGLPVKAESVTVDPGDQDLYVGERSRITQLTSSGALVARFGSPPLEGTTPGVAVDASGGATSGRHVYATNRNPNEGKVDVWGPLITLPDVVTSSASGVTGEGATLNGTVNPDGLELKSCRFEYGTTTDYSNVGACDLTPGEIGSGHTPVAVKTAVSGLNGGSAFHFRLVATNECENPGEQCESDGGDAEFSTLGPRIAGVAATGIGSVCAKLEATVNPEGATATYSFEYTTEGQFVLQEWAGSSSAPIPPAALGSGTLDIPISQEVCGLAPRTTYHFRLKAGSSEGVDTTDGETFTTFAVPGSGLPDHRQYEQASPVDKNGNSVQGEENAVEASVNGDKITFYANGGIPGGEGAQDFPAFVATRASNGSGWSTQGLLPPAATGPSPGAEVLGWDEELATVYDKGRRPEEPEAFYRRSLSGRTLTEILSGAETSGGAETNFRFDAATPDGNTVAFEAENPLLPGAAATGPNLYVWDQASGQLTLAGVLNDGAAPSAGAFAGPYDWYNTPTDQSEPGALRKYYLQSAHVLASDGSAVFFTAAGSGRLYERLNPTQEQSALDGDENCTELAKACTLELSASKKTNGEGAGQSDPAGPRPAAFVAANADGSRAFLLSSEELTNDANTGPSPSISRSDLEGVSRQEGFLTANASALAVDSTHIYWANPARGTVGRAKLDGSEPEPEFIKEAGTPEGVAVDAEHVYWTNRGTGLDGGGTIGRAKIDGSDPEPSFIATGVSNPRGIAVSGTNIFWANGGTTAATRKIARTALAGTGLIQLIPVSGTSGAAGLTIQGTSIYWANPSEAAIGRANVSGASVVQSFIAGAGEAGGLASDAEHLYWTDAAAGRVVRAPLAGGSTEATFITNLAGPQALAVDGAHIYWGSNAGDRGADLYRYESTTGELMDLSPDSGAPNGAEVKGILGTSTDGSHIYFVANGKLASGATAGGCVGAGENVRGLCNLYLWDEGETRFITRLEAAGGAERSDEVDWTPAGQSLAGTTPSPKGARVSADGTTVLFRSQRQLGAFDNKGIPEFYRSVEAGAPVCVTCSPTGAAPASAPRLQGLLQPTFGPQMLATVLTRNLSSNGRRVFFATSDKLVASDENGVSDVYEWEAEDEGTCRSHEEDGGCLYLLSTGTSPRPSFFADASSSGNDAFFFTAQPLVSQDSDELVDVYDVRVEGGIAGQNIPPQPPCSSEQECLPPAAPQPSSPVVAPPSGESNPQPAVQCRKGFKKARRGKKLVCVKARHKQKPKHHRKSKKKATKKSSGKGAGR